jgi:hypothetical protein
MAPMTGGVMALGLIAVAIGTAAPGWAQGPSGVLRVALLPQWTIQQHGPLNPVLRQAVEGGVVDRTVFAWQRGVIQRQSLVWKPIRVVPEPEAAALGGRGQFASAVVRPPTGRAAWTEVEVSRPTPQADDVLVLEIGGERNTMTQVLETLLMAEPGRELTPFPLVRTALVAAPGVPVVAAPFERPLPPALAERFHEDTGLGLLVARSPLWDVRNGDLTASGVADTVPLSGGDWREGDRVFVRVPAAVLTRGAPGLILGWKDRTLQTDPDAELPRRSSLPVPLIR